LSVDLITKLDVLVGDADHWGITLLELSPMMFIPANESLTCFETGSDVEDLIFREITEADGDSVEFPLEVLVLVGTVELSVVEVESVESFLSCVSDREHIFPFG